MSFHDGALMGVDKLPSESADGTGHSPGTGSHLGGDHVRIKDVSLKYRGRDGTDVRALTGVDVTIRDREFISLLGPSGCGKSTLLKILAGLIKPTTGTLEFVGAGPDQKVGLVPQAATLMPWLRVVDNVMLPAKILKMPKDEAREKAMALLDTMGLKGFDRRYPRELSGGMQQRVSIARALLHNPQILLMDEPFAALDALTRDRLSMELQSIWLSTEKTCVFVTHSISEAVFLSDRILVMSNRPGRIIAEFVINDQRPRDIDRLTPEAEELTATIRKVLEADNAGGHR